MTITQAPLQTLVFYALDKAIRSYRRLAQAHIDTAGIDITVDQWLVLQVLLEDDTLTQSEIAERVFKDQASVARIMALLTKRGLLAAQERQSDGRRNPMRITAEGHKAICALEPVVLNYRRQALRGLTASDVDQLQHALERIIRNCSLDE